jgi:hypothetical protein
MAMESELTPTARNEKRGRNIDLGWNTGVDHEFNAAETRTLDCPLRLKIAKAANGNFKLCTEATYIALKRIKGVTQQ